MVGDQLFRDIVRAVAAGLAVMWPCAVSAAPAPEVLRFAPLQDSLSKNEIQVYGGAKPVAGDWRSIVIASMPAASGLRSCTATLVGPKVLLTAAHCVDAGDDKPVRVVVLQVASKDLTFDCAIDEAYLAAGFYNVVWPRSDTSPDYALCAMRPMAGPVPALFDSYPRDRLDLAALKANDPVLITGYGCVQMDVDLQTPDLKPGPFAAAFNVGDETVDTIGSRVVTTKSAAAKEPALCFGDSGGPLFSGVTTASPETPRRLRAVNSQVSVSTFELVSTMATLSSNEFRQFLACWRKTHPGYHIFVHDESLVPACAG